jgi:hypothetical protein
MKFKYLYGVVQLAVLPLLSTTSHASEGEAIRYLEHCRTAVRFAGPSAPNPIDAMNMGFCLGLMDGLRGANHFLKKADPASAFCEPATYDNRDLAKAFVEIAGASPEVKELRGALAAQVALRTAFPCEKRK